MRRNATSMHWTEARATLGGAVIVVGAALLFGGCGTTGTETASLARTPIPADKARVTLVRPSTIIYAGVPATVTVNGKQVANLATGGQTVFDIAPGQNVIAASAWSYPGTFSIKLNAKPGATYALKVEPRTDSFVPGMLFGVIGGAIDASVNENAGAFQLSVETDVAPATGAAVGTGTAPSAATTDTPRLTKNQGGKTKS